jgi:hypothetical protein
LSTAGAATQMVGSPTPPATGRPFNSGELGVLVVGSGA